MTDGRIDGRMDGQRLLQLWLTNENGFVMADVIYIVKALTSKEKESKRYSITYLLKRKQTALTCSLLH